jgi:N-acetyl sugar amidotransferase
MDTTVEEISFDKQGVCNFCHAYDRKIKEFVITGEEGKKKAQYIADYIKAHMIRSKYHCVIGTGGGVDSSWLVCVAASYGLNPLVVHVDNGWNTEASVNNIHKITKYCNVDLYTVVFDWNNFRDIQMTFLKAGIPDLEIPTDHLILAAVNKEALKRGIPFVLSGANARTESHIPPSWSQGHWDWKYMESIWNEYGTGPFPDFPVFNYIGLLNLMRVKWIRILNYLDYNKFEAKKQLLSYGWTDYGPKHFESIFTRFYQGYILPVRFNADKRKSHLSSLICAGIYTREQALIELNRKVEYTPAQIKQDKDYFIKKFRIDEKEFNRLMNLPKRSYHDFPNNEWILKSDWFQKIYQSCTRL